MTSRIRSGSGMRRRTAALLVAGSLMGALASAPAFAQPQGVERRWELDEIPFEERSFVRKAEGFRSARVYSRRGWRRSEIAFVDGSRYLDRDVEPGSV